MIPNEQALVQSMTGKPFVLIGINSDGESRSALKEKFQNEKVTWPQFIEGRERTISQKWNVSAYPTLYIIDHEGVIRNRNIHGPEQVDQAVAGLLARIGATGGK